MLLVCCVVGVVGVGASVGVSVVVVVGGGVVAYE